MFGLRHEFEYRECQLCRSLWLAPELTPEELGRYYGSDYYSYTKREDGRVHTWLLNQRDRAELGENTLIGRLMASRRPNTTMRMIGTLGLPKTARILDVGCGGGRLLDRLKSVDFVNLMGVDPFVESNQSSAAGASIRKGYLTNIEEKFDLIMYHHAMEHTADPVSELEVVREHLLPNGRCLVRIPTVSSAAWDRYGVDWVQLDAPRHLAIPSREGMARAVRLAGLRLVDTIDDSTLFQFEGSERYRAGVPLVGHQFALDPADKSRFERETATLNSQGRGDQTGFVLTA